MYSVRENKCFEKSFFYIFKTNIRNVYFKVTFKCYNNELVWLNFGICMTYSLKFLLLMATSGV